MGGAVILGTFDEVFARTLVEQMPGIVSVGTTASAGWRALARRTERELHRALEAAIATRAFHPVFQSIVDLESGETMGYEALTRFDSGSPRTCASPTPGRSASGSELEIATLEAAVAAAKSCPTAPGSTSTSRRACSPTPGACAGPREAAGPSCWR